jgi:hypothetical protein
MNLSEIIKIIDEEFVRDSENVNGIEMTTLYTRTEQVNYYPEDKVGMQEYKRGDIYNLYSISRANINKVDTIKGEIDSYVMLLFLAKRKLQSSQYNSDVQREIMGAKSIEEISNILDKNVAEPIYNIAQHGTSEINLEKENQKFNVFYYNRRDEKVNIVANRELNNACLVIYNFSIRMIEFYKSLEKLGLDRNTELAKRARDIYIK